MQNIKKIFDEKIKNNVFNSYYSKFYDQIYSKKLYRGSKIS